MTECTYDIASIARCFDAYIKATPVDDDLFNNFGEYSTIDRNKGIRPADLADARSLIMPLIVLNPSCKWKETPFRAGIGRAIAMNSHRLIATSKPLNVLTKYVFNQVPLDNRRDVYVYF